MFSTKAYDREYFRVRNRGLRHDISFFEARLSPETASLAVNFPAVCAFVNDHMNEPVLRSLSQHGTRLIALHSAGFNNVDLKCAKALGITVTRVPAYSPHAVAEHALALILSLNRKTFRAFNRVREGNFALDGLLGFDLFGKTVGVIGTGRIGAIFARIMLGLGCRVLAYDPNPDPNLQKQVDYLTLPELYREADIISLHCPLVPQTHHMINDEAIAQMKEGIMLINTSRGRIIDTRAVIKNIKSGKIGYLGLDVYEEEEDLFFSDLSDKVIQDDAFMRLLTFPNVLITGHQGFFTREALTAIADTTLANITAFETGEGDLYEVTTDNIV
ncbi:2-hydroxyacid dehydrogenase [Gilvimarinus sp. F26214L]|uniref:2-hydroxyacid dehydrogenase n=1 Tax=Gilvimarinus sp. DZF01 TaxID=3461371 RepID=UPI0040462E4B